jgi:hypothetical protein
VEAGSRALAAEVENGEAMVVGRGMDGEAVWKGREVGIGRVG